MILECFADADHGGETVDTKSTTGGVCVLKGIKTFGAVEWGAKKQGSTSRNTTEAELVATADVTQKAALPLSSLFEALLRRTVSIVVRALEKPELGVNRACVAALNSLLVPVTLRAGPGRDLGAFVAEVGRRWPSLVEAPS